MTAPKSTLNDSRTKRKPDAAAEIERLLHTLHPDGGTLELRIPKTPADGTQAGYYDDYLKLAQDALRWSGQAPGIYVSLNPVSKDPDNKLTKVTSTTKDDDIRLLVLLLI